MPQPFSSKLFAFTSVLLFSHFSMADYRYEISVFSQEAEHDSLASALSSDGNGGLINIDLPSTQTIDSNGLAATFYLKDVVIGDLPYELSDEFSRSARVNLLWRENKSESQSISFSFLSGSQLKARTLQDSSVLGVNGQYYLPNSPLYFEGGYKKKSVDDPVFSFEGNFSVLDPNSGNTSYFGVVGIPITPTFSDQIPTGAEEKVLSAGIGYFYNPTGKIFYGHENADYDVPFGGIKRKSHSIGALHLFQFPSQQWASVSGIYRQSGMEIFGTRSDYEDYGLELAYYPMRKWGLAIGYLDSNSEIANFDTETITFESSYQITDLWGLEFQYSETDYKKFTNSNGPINTQERESNFMSLGVNFRF